jgi:type IV secretion system protein VirB8
MKSPSKPQDANPASKQDVFAAGMSWEASRIRQVETSERRAWYVAITSVVVTVLLVVGFVMLLPLKETVPYLVRVDSVTGATDIVNVLDTRKVDFSEALQKANVVDYLRSRESYDWFTLTPDYNRVMLMSSPSVGKDYANLYAGSNALQKKYGQAVRVKVNVISVVLSGHQSATVRFTRNIKRVDDDGDGETTHWVATIAYEYRQISRLKEAQTWDNPTGFVVTSYRVDSEVVGGGAQ